MKETQFCRCCLTQECNKNMFSENEKEEEVYVDMLFNTFNIKLSNSGCKPCLICNKCITKLRDATEFKQQVLNAQETMISSLNSAEFNSQLKIEVDDFDDKVSDHFSDSDFMWENKQESQKGQVFVIKLEPKKDEQQHNVLKTVKLNNFTKKVPRNASDNNTCNKSPLKPKKITKVKKISCNNDKEKTEVLKTVKAKSKQRDSKYETPPITQTEINARENTLKLIENSNLCLFRSLKTKFGCFMCKATFVELSKLREHSATHTNTTFLAYRVSKWRGLSYKNAEISNLKCNKCSENLTDLSQLMKHLTDSHNITFTGTNNFLIPYKLADENQCALCESKFNTFLRLSMHMNSHYTNNVCEICGLSFINRISLRTHVQSMHREKKCSHCPAKFWTVSSKVAHLKKVHNVYNMKRYCNLCEKTFPYTYMLVKHKIEEHGAKKTIVNCSDCGKTFFHEANLKVHVRSVHIRERNYPCDVCGTRFFTKCDKKRHEKTHNDVRSFSCSYCEAKFKSKDSWRRHMKRQHGHVFS